MTNIRTLLLIDDNPVHAEVFWQALLNSPDRPFYGEWIKSFAESLERLKKKDVWAIFLNLRLGDSECIGASDKLRQIDPSVPTLVLGGVQDELICLEALRRGAKDYLLEGHIDRYSFVRAIRHMAEREAAEELLFTEKQRAQITLDSIGDGVLCTDIRGNVTYLNAVAETMTGWLRKEALGRPLAEVFEIIDGVTRESAPNPMALAIEKNKTVGLAANCILIRRDGYESAIEDSAAPIHDRLGAVTGAVIVFHDMGISRTTAGEMKHLAEHDILTDLPNRLLLKDRLSQAIATAHRNNTEIAVLFLDLDEFKKINDSLGHAIADKLLQSVAARLVNCVRSSDTVSRQGGDEFVVLLPEIKHAADAHITARKILKALAEPHEIDRHSLQVTTSIGVSTYPEDGVDAEALIQNADAAMYRVKGNGRNNYQFFKNQMSPTDQAPIPERVIPEAAVDEFGLCHGPKINRDRSQSTEARSQD
jgi:diguanylate cyclase (GGDEF)-like protein/PAS domain S-box-containing protein